MQRIFDDVDRLQRESFRGTVTSSSPAAWSPRRPPPPSTGRAEAGLHRRALPETKEYLGGFWVIEAADLDVALALAAEGSKACRGTVEVRPFRTEESVRALSRDRSHRRAGDQPCHHEEWARVVADLARRFGDLDVAEEATAEAFVAAAERWPREGVPPNPGGWLATTATRKAIDRLRRESQRDAKHQAARIVYDDTPPEPTGPVEDDRLRLVFTCCHPALAMEARVALTLRLLGGLTVPEIARAFLVQETTMARRITRAKARSRRHTFPTGCPGRRHPRAARRRARGRLPRLQRGLSGRRGGRPGARRPHRRGDPPRPPAPDSPPGRRRGSRPACPDAPSPTPGDRRACPAPESW